MTCPWVMNNPHTSAVFLLHDSCARTARQCCHLVAETGRQSADGRTFSSRRSGVSTQSQGPGAEAEPEAPGAHCNHQGARALASTCQMR